MRTVTALSEGTPVTCGNPSRILAGWGEGWKRYNRFEGREPGEMNGKEKMEIALSRKVL